jgi:hypothetical protein
MAIGLLNKLNQALWRATLQPRFSYRDTDEYRVLSGALPNSRL